MIGWREMDVKIQMDNMVSWYISPCVAHVFIPTLCAHAEKNPHSVYCAMPPKMEQDFNTSEDIIRYFLKEVMDKQNFKWHSRSKLPTIFDKPDCQKELIQKLVFDAKSYGGCFLSNETIFERSRFARAGMLHTTLVPIDLESSGEFIFIRYHDFCNMGGERLTLQVEQTIRTLSKEGNSYSVIVKKLKAEGLDVGKATICRVVNGIGKKREAESNGQKFQVDRPRPVRTPATVSKVKRLATTENPPSQRQLSRMCGTSLKTINNIIHKDLELDTRRKGKVHKLTPFHMKNRATNARKLYEEHLAGSRSEYTATLDEAWMYVTYCNGIRKICYIKRGNQVPDNWVHQCSETFPKGFMVVGVMTGRGVLPLIKVPSKVKVNSEFYIECVLKPVIEQLKDLYPGEMDKVFLHHDKASFHTSNKTQQFLQEMKYTLGLNFIRNSDIPVKSPDASPLDFYGFGMLKQRLFNRRPKTEAGLWKAAQEEWSNVSLSKVKEVFAAWKVRCREIAKKKGKHIEHMKKIHPVECRGLPLGPGETAPLCDIKQVPLGFSDTWLKMYGIVTTFVATRSGLLRFQDLWDTNETRNTKDKPFYEEHVRSIDELFYKRAVDYHYHNSSAFVFSVPFDAGTRKDDPLVTGSHAIFLGAGLKKAPAAVVGLQFKHSAFAKRFFEITSTVSRLVWLDCTTLEQRAVIRFLNAEGIQISQICQRMKNIYADNLNISYGTVHTVIKEQLQFRKICCRWIPHFLNLDLKLNRIRVSKALLKRYEEEGDHFLDQIVTGDESWCYHYDPSTKRASMESKRGDSPRPKKKNQVDGPICLDFLSSRQRMNSDLYCDILVNKLKPGIRKKRRGKLSKGILFLHDNARPHTSCKTVSTIIKLGFEVLYNPAYSPDLALYGYFLFGLLKKELKGKRFDSDEDVQKVVQDFFHTLPKSAYKEGIYKLPERWRRGIESQGINNIAVVFQQCQQSCQFNCDSSPAGRNWSLRSLSLMPRFPFESSLCALPLTTITAAQSPSFPTTQYSKPKYHSKGIRSAAYHIKSTGFRHKVDRIRH
ncbi:hypothetical protein LAZ67_5000627 [Cordylochernes scorpioides]|uniref:Transposase n=1 Tax=Cordylochernes scorpioides TaxID=51811 RepID=A0ABY6KF33_9ARAC|nr:hypothetical protein LAZ67_5000627 [Cordylochernes scorpioides]